MTVEYVCEQCDHDNPVELSQQVKQNECKQCGDARSISMTHSMREGDVVDRCALCDRNRFYVQKDFNPRLGILIFVLGVALSYHTYFISLAVATLIDFILYQILPTVTICYHCRAIYRGFKEEETHRGFDHNLALSLVDQEGKSASVAS